MIAVAAMAGCGRKGPPLPPLVRIPAPPGEFTANRRGDVVDLQFVVPAANTDNTRPANIERITVYALTGPVGTSDAEILKRGEPVASLQVKAPKNPDQAAEPDEPLEDVDPPEGPGLDQGAVARVREHLEGSAAVESGTARMYLAVGTGRRGRRGAPSKRVAVPLVSPPAAPSAPKVAYDEKTVTVTWTAATSESLTYNVYEVGAREETLLTKMPVAGTAFSDPRVVFGAKRCYAVRAVRTSENLSVESDEQASSCETFADTFPPAAPKGLQALPSQGLISLIWDASPEPDLDGYRVFRGTSPEVMEPVTPIIHETTFQDGLASGTRYFYAIQAIDKTGNAGPPSAPVEETAR